MSRKYWSGVVLKKYQDHRTIKIEVTRDLPHPKYGKVIKVKKKFLVDIDVPSCEKLILGDTVTVQECKKVSKLKSKQFISVRAK